jgi:hypothetical protein
MIAAGMNNRLTQLLDELPAQFRAAMEADLEFREWCAANKFNPEFMRRFAFFVEASEPYAQAYREIADKFPQALQRVNDLLLPIQREIRTGIALLR